MDNFTSPDGVDIDPSPNTTADPASPPPVRFGESQKSSQNPNQQSDGKQFIDTTGVTKWEETQSNISILESMFGAKVIVFYVSISSSLVEEDVDYLYDHIRNIGKTEKIALFTYGPGGSVIASARIVYVLRKYAKELISIIPSNAASAMTMLSLGANKIMMGPLSALSPIDVSLPGHPLAPKDKNGNPVRVEVTQIQKFIELLNSGMTSKTVDDIKKSPYTLLSEHIHPVVVGSIQRVLSLSKMLTTDILQTHISDLTRIEEIVNKLNDEFPTHGYPITFEKAKDMGIPVEMMTDEQNTSCLKFLKILHLISRGGETEKEGVKIKFNRPTIIESLGVRTNYYSEQKYVLDQNKAWTSAGGKGQYAIFVPKKDERGIMRIKAVQSADLW